MSKRSANRALSVFVVLLFAVIVIFFWAAERSSHYPNGTEKYCEQSNSGREECATYNELAVPFLKLAKFLNVYSGIITALSGVAVAVFTGTLWWVTWGMVDLARNQRIDLLRSIEAAEHSAEAAVLSAQTVIGVEIARLELHDASFTFYNDDIVHDALNTGRMEIRFRNHGRTAARVTEDCVVARVASMLPGSPRYPMSTVRRLPFGLTITSNDLFTIKCEGRLGLSEEQVLDVIERENNLWVFGYVIYQDFLDNYWETRFCLILGSDRTERRFEEANTYPEYNYRKRWKPESLGENRFSMS